MSGLEQICRPKTSKGVLSGVGVCVCGVSGECFERPIKCEYLGDPIEVINGYSKKIKLICNKGEY